MIKNSFLFLFLFFGVTALMGQSRDFPTGEATWKYFIFDEYYDFSTGSNGFSLAGDTLIDDTNYQIIDDGSAGFFRTEEKKVYYLPADSTDAYLYYDFDLIEGDTFFNIQPLSHEVGSFYDTLIVSQIDSVLMEDGYRKRWYFEPGGGSQWIEGIGSTSNLIAPTYYVSLSGGTVLSCFKRDSSWILESSEGIYQSNYYGVETVLGYVTCDGYILPTDNPLGQSKNVQLSPNPFTHQFKILSPTLPDGTIVEIYSVHGQFLKSIPYQGQISLPELPLGTYLLIFKLRQIQYTSLFQKL